MTKVQILWVARSVSNVDSVVRPHSHEYYHMFYVKSGRLEMVVDGETAELEEGTCLLVPRKTEHSYTIAGECAAEYLEIKFALPDKVLDEQFAVQGIRVSQRPLIGMLFEQIVDEYSELGSRADEVTVHYLLSLLYTLTLEQRFEKREEFRYVDASGFSPLSKQVIRYLEEHYAQQLSLDQLAQALNHGKSYLCSAFKKDTGTTILDCLNMIRIHRAAELITYSDNSMAQVSSMCGFASPNNFNRVFMKYTGVTPSQCRRAYPAEVFLDSGKKKIPNSGHFLYSVLARKKIPGDTYLSAKGSGES